MCVAIGVLSVQVGAQFAVQLDCRHMFRQRMARSAGAIAAPPSMTVNSAIAFEPVFQP